MNQAIANRTSTHQALAMPIRSYAEFYRFYLTEHSNMMSRRLHVAGSVAGLYGIYQTLQTGRKSYLLKGVLTGYACAWVGHFFFEKNRPASFKQPFYSFISDWCMLTDVCRGRLSLRHRKHDKMDEGPSVSN